MPRKSRWYDAVPEATAVVDCGGEKHRVTWRRGKVVLEDHDLSAERGMLAFGGELCGCMRVLEMWVEQFRMPPELFVQLRSWLGPNADLAPLEFDLHRRLGMILSWARAWRASFHLNRKHEKLLGDVLKDTALGPLRQHQNAWKPKTGARVVSGCQVAVVPTSQPAAVEGTTDRVAMRLTAALHPRWSVDVWPRGIALVDDAFVVELTEAATADDLRVLAVRWEPNRTGTWAAVTAPARIRRDAAGAWHLTWEEGPAESTPPPAAAGWGPAGLRLPQATTGVVQGTGVPGAKDR